MFHEFWNFSMYVLSNFQSLSQTLWVCFNLFMLFIEEHSIIGQSLYPNMTHILYYPAELGYWKWDGSNINTKPSEKERIFIIRINLKKFSGPLFPHLNFWTWSSPLSLFDLGSFLLYFLKVKIFGDVPELLECAAEHFLGKSEEDIGDAVKETLQGHQRSVIVTMNLEVRKISYRRVLRALSRIWT